MLLGFKRRFAPYVRDGSKRHTIRGKRKNRPKVGETCHCYVDPRQKTMALLGRWRCVKLEDIVITERQTVLVDGVILSDSECNELAWCDGFRDGPKDEAFVRMMQFWEGRLPFVGDIIHWAYEDAGVRRHVRHRSTSVSAAVCCNLAAVTRSQKSQKSVRSLTER